MKRKYEPRWAKIYREQVLKPAQRERLTEKIGRSKASQLGWYNTPQWKDLRNAHIKANPFCVECEKRGRIVQAEVVDHIKPVDDYPELFLDSSNLQSLCNFDHRLKTLRDKKEKAAAERINKGKKLMNDLESDSRVGG
ncbi:MAG: hypothetical protein A2W90_02505 [Bacteroidetes bacterium GWF2_42_66]|nr:MAG: hypothetical protein A2W92_16205 [Bacteroidetes bacterium GWA2_42_15]OFY01222.1 MAG: hypothetical protein A2W89_15990 [Bacteroidetes bacterium GWE2_42_39]OFY42065.1 MAG: hypothetical protein A2W90_02505 [Bacteroidetes bacterium GWF2_42_66]HBL77732.1 HNH endonuclease [Prolixibacteraceae bacterium]HCB62861.1 HNH endonuclease [Bacteroidales bacterium]